jgi:hypothetical protein
MVSLLLSVLHKQCPTPQSFLNKPRCLTVIGPFGPGSSTLSKQYPYLTDFEDLVPILQVFAEYICTPELAPSNDSCQSCLVEDYVCLVGQEIGSLGALYPCILVKGNFDLHLKKQLKGYSHLDAPLEPIKPIPMRPLWPWLLPMPIRTYTSLSYGLPATAVLLDFSSSFGLEGMSIPSTTMTLYPSASKTLNSFLEPIATMRLPVT